MAGFPGTVNLYPSIGVPGAYASNNPVVTTPTGYAAGANITVGSFCWADGENAGLVLNTGTGAPLGFVVREVTSPIVTQAEAQDYVPEGYAVSVAVAGDFFATPTATVTAGQKVFASTTDGTIKGAAAGSTEGGYIETPFYFVTGGDEGDTVIISSNVIGVVPTTAVPATYVTGVTSDGNAQVTVTTNSGSNNFTINNVANATTAGSCSGNAATASKLETARDITLSGTANGTASFDGSQNVTITTTGA